MSRGFDLYMVKYPMKRGSKVFNLAFTRGGWPTRRGATQAFVKSQNNARTWKQFYAQGCRVVVVRSGSCEMSDLSELIERLERSSGPDRELDLAIGQAVGAANHDGPAHHRPFRDWAKHYTASLDAALTLVSGVGGINIQGYNDIWYAVVRGHYSKACPSPALALTIAALKARVHLRSASEKKVDSPEGAAGPHPDMEACRG